MPNLDALPFPAYALFPMKKYTGFPGWGVMGSRGCPYKCIFCLSPKTWGAGVRFRSAQNIADEIEYLHREFGIERVTFFDDTINIPPQRAIAICDELIKRKLHKDMSFECQMRANRQLISPEVFNKMREANFIAVYFGIESGSDKVLRAINKSLTSEEAMRAVKIAQKAGIKKVAGFFMVGQWDETIYDVIKTWCFMLSSRIEASVAVCVPFPGTDFYALLRRNGLIEREPEWGNFNKDIPQVRTNKMSRALILTVMLFSNIEILILDLLMRHKLSFTITRIVNFGISLCKDICQKARQPRG